MVIKNFNNINERYVMKWHCYMKIIWLKKEGDNKYEPILPLFFLLVLLSENNMGELKEIFDTMQ